MLRWLKKSPKELPEQVSEKIEDRQKLSKKWEAIIPWFLTAASTAVLVIIGHFLFENLIWMREHSFSAYDTGNLEYRSHAYFLYVSSVRRSIGLISGIALTFLGVAVAFYSVKSQTKLDVSTKEFTFGLITASPGILAIVLGVFLIAHNTSSKDSIPIYINNDSENPPALQPDLPEK